MKTSLEEQIDSYAELIAKNPEDLENLTLYGDANLQSGRRLAALSAFQKVLTLDPENLRIRNKLISIYLHQKMFEAASKELLIVFEKDPNNIVARYLQIEMDLIKGENSLPSDVSEALKNIANNFKPDLTEVLDLLETLTVEKAELENQIKDYQEKLNSFPEELYLEFNFQMCLRTKNTKEALILFLQKIEEEVRERLHQEKERLREEEERERIEEEERIRVEEEERLRIEEEERIRVEEEERLRVEEEERLRVEEEERLRVVEEEREKEEKQALAEQRKAKLSSVFGDKLDKFASHKMVSEVLIADLSGLIVKSSDNFNAPHIGSIIAEGLAFVKSWNKMDYWVIEYQQGLIFVKMIAKDLILVVIGGIGSNFGALRFVIDRNEKDLIGTIRSSEFASLLDDK